MGLLRHDGKLILALNVLLWHGLQLHVPNQAYALVLDCRYWYFRLVRV